MGLLCLMNLPLTSKLKHLELLQMLVSYEDEVSADCEYVREDV